MENIPICQDKDVAMRCIMSDRNWDGHSVKVLTRTNWSKYVQKRLNSCIPRYAMACSGFELCAYTSGGCGGLKILKIKNKQTNKQQNKTKKKEKKKKMLTVQNY